LIKSIYIIGSLKNPEILSVHKELEALGLEPFSDWKCPGPDADDFLRDYYRERGLSYSEILESYGVRHVFEFDRYHLSRCDAALMVMPAGKSGHLELGYCVGLDKPAFILMDQEPERVDVMHAFATKVFMNRKEMNEYFRSSGVSTIGSGLAEVSGCENGSLGTWPPVPEGVPFSARYDHKTGHWTAPDGTIYTNTQGSGRKVLRKFFTYSEAAKFTEGRTIVFNEEDATYEVLGPTTRLWKY